MTPSSAAEPHPDVQAFLELYESLDTPEFSEITPEEARRMFEEMRVVEESDIELASVEDHTIDGPHGDLAVRSYDPGPRARTGRCSCTFTGADGSSAASTPTTVSVESWPTTPAIPSSASTTGSRRTTPSPRGYRTVTPPSSGRLRKPTN